jgi:hypothetical protein
MPFPPIRRYRYGKAKSNGTALKPKHKSRIQEAQIRNIA